MMTKFRQIRKQAPPARRVFVIHRVVLGIPQTAFSREVSQMLRKNGYEVEFAISAESARRRAIGHDDTAVVVPVAHEAEGGLLATAKVVNAMPNTKVVLLAQASDERLTSFAEFIDAAIAFETEGPEAVVSAIAK